MEFPSSRAERKVARTWSRFGCVEDVLPRPPIQEMWLTVARALLHSGLVECVCSVAVWVLCVH